MADNTNSSSSTTDNQNSSNTKKPVAKSYRYPIRQIKSNTDYLEIKIVKYIPPGIGDLGGNQASLLSFSLPRGSDQYKTINKEKILTSICLPIPQNISDANSVTWGDDNLNPLQAAGLNALASLRDPKKMLEKAANVPGDVLNQLIKSERTRNLVLAATGTKLLNTFGGNVPYNSVIGRTTGQVFNTNLELLFSGPGIRTFPFTFDFIPRDRREAAEVKDIIRTFKKHMSAKNGKTDPTESAEGFAKGATLSAPDIFILKYKTGNQNHPFLNKFKPCALLDMNVNYTGSGTYSTYQDSTPVHLQMTLTFKELNPIYAEDYEDQSVAGGVGY